jgi:hypothetical protein
VPICLRKCRYVLVPICPSADMSSIPVMSPLTVQNSSYIDCYMNKCNIREGDASLLLNIVIYTEFTY